MIQKNLIHIKKIWYMSEISDTYQKFVMQIKNFWYISEISDTYQKIWYISKKSDTYQIRNFWYVSENMIHIKKIWYISKISDTYQKILIHIKKYDTYQKNLIHIIIFWNDEVCAINFVFGCQNIETFLHILCPQDWCVSEILIPYQNFWYTPVLGTQYV